ncbi:hypothetical protein [Ramlibacter sp. AN1133]|uniref:hypothetical protein n=1 Tax=Ramlibacter sp. AN1133 TaxID=3133429 RepID=UPI0030C0066A
MSLRWMVLAVAVFAAPAGFGQTAAAIAQQMQRVEGALNRLSQEQVAVYQQFQMVQEMRRNEERLALQRLPIYRQSTLVPPSSIDDIQRDADARTQRMNELQAEGDRLYGRYRELEDQKRPLLDALSTLAQATPEAAADVQAGAAAIPVPTPVPPVTQPSPGFTGTFPGFTGGSPGFAPAPVPPPLPANPSR